MQRDEPAGTHHPDGVLIAYGPGIRAGKVIERRQIVDVAALLLHSVGLGVPSDFEGVVPEALFTEESLADRPKASRPGRFVRPCQTLGADP